MEMIKLNVTEKCSITHEQLYLKDRLCYVIKTTSTADIEAALLDILKNRDMSESFAASVNCAMRDARIIAGSLKAVEHDAMIYYEPIDIKDKIALVKSAMKDRNMSDMNAYFKWLDACSLNTVSEIKEEIF